MSLENLEVMHEVEYLGPEDDGFEEVNITPTVSIQDKLNRVISVLGNLDKVFIYSGRLAIIKRGKLFIAVDIITLSIILSSFFKFYQLKVNKDGRETVTYHSLDDNHLRLLQERIQDANLREIVYFSNTPVLLKVADDKYKLSEQGYNLDSRVYVGENNLKPVYEQIAIDKALSGFHFKSSVDKVNVLGFLFTGFFHHLFPGRIPSLRIEGNQRNVGKTLLAMITAIIVQGKEGHILSLSDNEDELEKRLCSIVINDEHVVIFDNVKPSKHLKEVGGMLLERLITSIFLQFRLLGRNNIFSALNSLLTIITTNGADTSADFASRTVACELHIQGNPVGKKFKHKDLVSFVSENLINIRCELLGMLDVWIKAGCPLSTNVAHRFQPWAELVGGVLETNSYTGFLSNQKDFQQSSGIVKEFEKCLEMMPKNSLLTAKQILERCRPKNSFFLSFDSVAMFSKKILTPLIGEEFEVEGIGKFIFESPGTNADKSAIFTLRPIENVPEKPEIDNILLLSKKVNEVKGLFEIPEEGECILRK